MPDKEFETPQEALKHYGKKGMRWGIRNEEKPTGGDHSGSVEDKKGDSDPVLDEYKAITAAQKPLSGREATRNLQNNIGKSTAKLDDGGPELGGPPKDLAKQAKRDERADKLESKAAVQDEYISRLQQQIDNAKSGPIGWYVKKTNENLLADAEVRRDQYREDAARAREGQLTSGQKKALIAAGVGAVVVGGLAYHSYAQKAKVAKWEEEAAAGNVDSKIKLYNHHMNQSKLHTWMFGSYVTDESWGREGFELPAGHVFHRLSTKDESTRGYKDGTYSLPDERDFNRYVAGFRGEKVGSSEFYHVTFKSSKSTKVPDLKTTIETLRETMEKESHLPVSREQALTRYQSMSGGSWNSSTSGSFFANLRSKGYGAIVDEMDAGVIGERPLVFFDFPNASPKQSRLLSDGEIANRERSIELMTKPPRKG